MSGSINFQCAACEADYEVEIPAIIEHPTEIVCPNCGGKPPPHRAHAFATALEDLLAATAQIRKKVRFELTIDSHDLPPPYGALEPGEAGIDFNEEEGSLKRPAKTGEEDEEEEEDDTPKKGGLFDGDEEDDLDEGFEDEDLDDEDEDEEDEDEDEEESEDKD